MNALLLLSVHGSLAFLLVWVLDRMLANRMRARGRSWWWMSVPFVFLVSIPISILPRAVIAPIAQGQSVWAPLFHADAVAQAAAGSIGLSKSGVWLWLWVAGAATYLLGVIVQTRAALFRWNRERLSVDSDLLGLLEDCKQEAGITAPIGLVVSDRVFVPALLGWLRPRILMPVNIPASMSRDQLRAVLFHELAHFRSLHIPLNWLFSLVRTIHWFNPLAHLAYREWAHFREQAADETAIIWMKAPSGIPYGEALLCALRGATAGAPPFGALAIGESIHNLKRRITMINHWQNKSPRFLAAGGVLILIIAGFIVRPIRADDTGDPKAAAVAAMQTWLQEIDQNQYGQSWTDASAFFQKALTSEKWIAALTSVRTPLGKCLSRKLASALHQKDVPGPAGTLKGDFVVAQFKSSFENLAVAVETVCFEKTPDGTWKASGYYIKPG